MKRENAIHQVTILKEIRRIMVQMLTLLRFIQSYFGNIISTLWPNSWTARERLVTTSPRPPTCSKWQLHRSLIKASLNYRQVI